ncbi:MAG TPA: tRNA pseudouridine(55) synthase TruB [Bacteroidetes bacterium]|jgi:tRNA pseudouridine55 synthase|nr:tRNA pseudouridine(55) synthase TruB [Bacteroidota bacterium]
MSEISIEEGGFLLINKPYQWTSFDVVKKLRNISRIKKIGHAGTLDPLATGLLIVCYGKYTKKIDYLQAKEKQYTGTFELGATTESFDLEQEVISGFPLDHITPELVEKAVSMFRGDIRQVPPQHSAIRVNGKRAYEHARKGEEVELKYRDAHIAQYLVDSSNLPRVSFDIICSKGTYIRSLARDLGVSLESAAYMSSLVRTRIGEYNVLNACQMEDIKTQEDFFKFAQQLEN